MPDDLLSYTPGELLAREVARGLSGASVRVSHRALLATPVTPAGAVLAGPQLPARPPSVADLMTNVEGDRRVIYPRETPAGALALDTVAAPIAEGAAAPEAALIAEVIDTTTKNVTSWIPMSDEIRMDMPGFAAYVDSRLADALTNDVDGQLVNGTGGMNQQVDGFLSVPGVLAVTAGASPQASITKGLRAVENRRTVADGVVIAPDDYWAIFDADSSWWGRLGLRVVRSLAVAAGTALVGSFASGAQVRRHGAVSIAVAGDGDGLGVGDGGPMFMDFLVRNRVAVKVSTNVQLALYRPDFFAAVDLAP